VRFFFTSSDTKSFFAGRGSRGKSERKKAEKRNRKKETITPCTAKRALTETHDDRRSGNEIKNSRTWKKILTGKSKLRKTCPNNNEARQLTCGEKLHPNTK